MCQDGALSHYSIPCRNAVNTKILMEKRHDEERVCMIYDTVKLTERCSKVLWVRARPQDYLDHSYEQVF